MQGARLRPCCAVGDRKWGAGAWGDWVSEAADRPSRFGEELRVLARRHPRATWTRHPDLGELARFWLARHEMFRRLDATIRSGTEAVLAERTEAVEIRPWLARHLRGFLWQLEEHHQVEDHHYFPLFRRAEPRLAAGFELLEGDHRALHAGLDGLVGRANLVLAHERPQRGGFRADFARFHDAQVDLGRQLGRHLDDEEDLVVPLLLECGEQRFAGGG